MLKRFAKRVLPASLHSGARSVRWWARFLFAAVVWRVQYLSRGLAFRVLDAWHRMLPPSLRSVAFPTVTSPEISVVIPVHDQYRFTARCLGSIARAAVGRSYEVIVVDDSSTDATPRRLAAVANLVLVENSGERGFVHACNCGAERARGRYVVFLNNDTMVEDGWSDALADTFDQFPRVGAVGAKLVFADGRLQEAGGIVWQDGSAWNYGRWMKPDAPRFSYARQVDYCSAACLMIDRELFERLGGFDVAFAPGYYEDTDLAFRVRAAGYTVHYQPKVRIRHYEGATAGRSLGAGMKQHQVAHRELFASRWQETLAGHRPNGVEPELEKERAVGRRLLLVEPRMIRPDRDSGSLRMFNLILILLDQGYRITLVPDNMLRLEPYVGQLQARGVEVLYAPFVPSVVAHLEEAGELYGIVLLSRLVVGREYVRRVRGYCPEAAVVFDTVDLHFVREEREAAIEDDEEKRLQALETKTHELDVSRRADATLVVSELEKRVLLEEEPSLPVFVVSNIHRQYESKRAYGDRRDILFIGGFEHPPNIDAVKWLLGEILPRARRLGFEGRVWIVGSHPPAAIRSLQSDDVVVTGYVADIAPLFEDCRLSVAPLRYGAGVKGKVNQSMARGLPVVATSMACEGMGVEDEVDVLMADGADDFARAICRLYDDEALWNRLVEGGRSNIERYYSFAQAGAAVTEALEFARQRTGMSPVWTVEQVAAFLKVDATTVSALVEKKAIPFFDLGGEVRFHRPDLQAWVAEQSRADAATSRPEARSVRDVT